MDALPVPDQETEMSDWTDLPLDTLWAMLSKLFSKIQSAAPGRQMEALHVPVPETVAAQPPAEMRDWSELPLDALSAIFSKLGSVDILMGAGLVCHSWLHAAKLPALWRSVRILRCIGSDWNTDKALAMAKAAVDRSDGRLELFETNVIVPDELLKYIGDRSASLKSLSILIHTSSEKGLFTDFIRKCPQLENLVITDSWSWTVGVDGVFDVIGKTCPQLKSLEVRKRRQDVVFSFRDCEDDASAASPDP